jgi:hypothetical protein
VGLPAHLPRPCPCTPQICVRCCRRRKLASADTPAETEQFLTSNGSSTAPTTPRLSLGEPT